MPRGALIRLRTRLGVQRLRNLKAGRAKKVRDEEEKLEDMEEKLEHVTDEVMGEITKIEKLKGTVPHKRHEFSWIKGEVSALLMEDFVGAGFGAIIFIFTQEVWEIALKLNIFSIIAVILISFITGLSLIYLSRRRKFLSMRIFHTAMLRGVEIYTVSFLTSLLFILIFGVFGYEPLPVLKGTVLITFPAVISAATADLLFY